MKINIKPSPLHITFGFFGADGVRLGGVHRSSAGEGERGPAGSVIARGDTALPSAASATAAVIVAVAKLGRLVSTILLIARAVDFVSIGDTEFFVGRTRVVAPGRLLQTRPPFFVFVLLLVVGLVVVAALERAAFAFFRLMGLPREEDADEETGILFTLADVADAAAINGAHDAEADGACGKKKKKNAGQEAGYQKKKKRISAVQNGSLHCCSSAVDQIVCQFNAASPGPDQRGWFLRPHESRKTSVLIAQQLKNKYC